MFSVEESYERHSEQLYKFIYLLTLNETLAEDLLQETFLRAFKALARFFLVKKNKYYE
jgi:RNA polymerase sigma-70 factor, ECF subfamily